MAKSDTSNSFDDLNVDLSASLDDTTSGDQTIGIFGRRNSVSGRYKISGASRVARVREIIKIVSRYHIARGLSPSSLRQMLEELGPTFVKAGQILSMRSEILPESFCNELKKLRSEVEPMDRQSALAALRAEYTTPLEEIFDAIDDVPLGSASVAQVHKARLITGELVAVKIQRPHVEETMAQDISIMRMLAKHASRLVEKEQFLDLVSVVDELWQSFLAETDFLVEAKSLQEFRRNNEHCRFVNCPKPYLKLCTRHVVVMEYVSGISIENTCSLKEAGYDLEEIGIKLVDNYTQQLLDDGFFHADPHPGNLVINDGKIIYMDFGIMGRLTGRDRLALKEMVYAVGTSNSERLKEGLLRFSISDTSQVNHAHLLADLDRMIANFGEAELSELDIGAFFNALVSMARKNGIQLPSTVMMLARSLVTLEGVVNKLLPEISIVTVIAKHLDSHKNLLEELDRENKRYMHGLHQASHALLDSVYELSVASKMLTRGQLRLQLDLPGTKDPMRDVTHAADRLTMGIVIAGLFIGSSVLYYARVKPVFMGIPVIGFIGYFAALSLGVWIVVSIMREGKRRKRR